MLRQLLEAMDNWLVLDPDGRGQVWFMPPALLEELPPGLIEDQI
ncbi:MAG TPA: hypothetical protein VM406_05340 [Noviherbaspirillum sp.]|nr:hypothetical protein [Noviherbaspirillum sp.]